MAGVESMPQRGRGLRTLLGVVALLAMLAAVGPPLYQRVYAVRRIPLADAVAALNVRNEASAVGQHEPRISEAEIVAAIQAQLPTLPAGDDVKAIYAEVVRSRTLPQDAMLSTMDGWTLSDGAYYTVWWINLEVKTGENAGYGLRIRENNAPVAKPPGEAALPTPSFAWIP